MITDYVLKENEFHAPCCYPRMVLTKWHPGVPYRWQSWLIGHTAPLICGACGGAQPDDIIRMLKEGWTDSMADCTTKGYVNPPGYREEVRAWRMSEEKVAIKIREERSHTISCPHMPMEGLGDLGLRKYPTTPISGPPVKFYISHFSHDQVVELKKLAYKGPAY